MVESNDDNIPGLDLWRGPTQVEDTASFWTLHFNPDIQPLNPNRFFFFITLAPRVEWYMSLPALDTSPPRNRRTFRTLHPMQVGCEAGGGGDGLEPLCRRFLTDSCNAPCQKCCVVQTKHQCAHKGLQLPTRLACSDNVPVLDLWRFQRRWVAKQGVEETASSRFVGALFHSLTDNCKAEDHGFDHILGAFRG